MYENLKNSLLKWMYHHGHSANSLRSKPSVTGNCVGRSMIEMLGVLAIIAVLSVGGVAGYSKAISSFKHNKWLYQIETLIFNIKEMYKSQGQYGKAYGSGGQDENIVPVLKSTGTLSAEVLDNNNKDLFGNRVFIYIRTWNGWIRPHIQFDMPAGRDAVENCKNLFRLPVEEQSIWSVEFCKGANCWDNWVYRLCGKSAPIEYINRGEKCEVATYNLSKVINFCKVCKSQPCTLLVIFDNNV